MFPIRARLVSSKKWTNYWDVALVVAFGSDVQEIKNSLNKVWLAKDELIAIELLNLDSNIFVHGAFVNKLKFLNAICKTMDVLLEHGFLFRDQDTIVDVYKNHHAFLHTNAGVCY